MYVPYNIPNVPCTSKDIVEFHAIYIRYTNIVRFISVCRLMDLLIPIVGTGFDLDVAQSYFDVSVNCEELC